MAVSAPRRDCHSISGARGEAHANEWPGAMIPALAAVTSWPAFARKYAVVTPTTPPPRTSVFTARSRLEQVAGPHGIVRIEQELAHAGEVGGAGDLGQDRAAPFHLGLAGDPAREVEPEEPAAHERGADPHEPAVMEERHARARARSARRGVHLARTPHERVGGHAVAVRQLVDEDVVHARLAEP